MAYASTLQAGERAQRKYMLTVAQWADGSTTVTELLGARTEDSSLEINPDNETSTDILGINYTDVNKTEPSQTFDPAFIMGGQKLTDYLAKAALTNDIDAYNGKFTVYIICGWIADGTDHYYTVKHSGCTILPNSLGGDSYVSLPYEVHLSNDLVQGYVPDISRTTLNSGSIGFVQEEPVPSQ